MGSNLWLVELTFEALHLVRSTPSYSLTVGFQSTKDLTLHQASLGKEAEM